MPKQPLSVTLDESNILWLRGRAHAGKERSLSEALDSLVTSARQSGYGGEIRSVVGTIDLSADDPGLRKADAAVRTMIDARLKRQKHALAGGPSRPRKAASRG